MAITVRGFVATPRELTKHMVTHLFTERPPTEGDRILYPGVGEGPFIEAVKSYCQANDYEMLSGYACDTEPKRLEAAKERFAHLPITFEQQDFLDLEMDLGEFEYVLGNPPYVPITELSETEKNRYKRGFETANDRFDLYLLFYERALNCLTTDGGLCFVTPEKFEYVETARPLRRLLSKYDLTRLEHLDQEMFTGRTTYPTISVVVNRSGDTTTIVSRDGNEQDVTLPRNGDRWANTIRNVDVDIEETGVTLGDVTERISPGVATGADAVFVFGENKFPPQLESWGRPTISGKELEQQPINESVTTESVFLCPYDDDGKLLPKSQISPLYSWAEKCHKERLKDRFCVQKGGKDWYAWHETPPMADIQQPKLLFRDLTKDPHFWVDRRGDIVPRHTVYYAVPREGVDIDELKAYLNTPEVRGWLHANCQRARNDFLRLQSRVLENLPVPRGMVSEPQTMLSDL